MFGHVADEGWVEACAGPLLRLGFFIFIIVKVRWLLAVAPIKMFPRYRKEIGAEDISILCDIKKKHSAHAVTADVR